MKRFTLRALCLFVGFFKAIWVIAVEGSRDTYNKVRFRNAVIGKGCCIDERCVIGKYVSVLNGTILNDVTLSSYSYISYNSLIQHTRIGKFCSIANEVEIGLGRHPIDALSTSPLFYRVRNPLQIKVVDKESPFVDYLPVEIGHDVWIGSRAIVLDGIRIGNGAIIAAGAVVTKDVPAYAIVAGVPAKIVRFRFSQQAIAKLSEIEWWNMELSDIRRIYNQWQIKEEE